jgi:hypothetical protein
MMEYQTSIQNLKKESKYTLDKVAIGESDVQRGRTDLRYIYMVSVGKVFSHVCYCFV